MSIPKNESGITFVETMESILTNEHTFTLADAAPAPEPSRGGRPREYPTFLVLLIDAMANGDLGFQSVRKVMDTLSTDLIWNHARHVLEAAYPNDPSRRLPAKPPSRTWFHKRLKAGVLDSLNDLRAALTDTGIVTARELGLLDPDGPGSYANPHRSRVIVADGKVIETLNKVTPGDTRKVEIEDPNTGEVSIEERIRRCDPDVKFYVDGTGANVLGHKFWHAEVRHEDFNHSRVVLAVDHVPGEKDEQNSENHIAVRNLLALSTRVPGATAVALDDCLGGEEKAELQRRTGWIVSSPVTAKRVDKSTGERVEKTAKVELRKVTFEDGHTEEIELWANGGWVALEVLTAEGTSVLANLRWLDTFNRKNDDGTYRCYVKYGITSGDGQVIATVTTRTDTNKNDRVGARNRHLNRSELIRQLPPGHPTYKRLKGYRASDSEGINSGIDAGLYLQRARSLGAGPQLFNLLTRAHALNSIALRRHRLRYAEPLPLAA